MYVKLRMMAGAVKCILLWAQLGQASDTVVMVELWWQLSSVHRLQQDIPFWLPKAGM